ncbi:MAG TPA: HD domain-containing phosphohydrolase [Planctomycetota bacterium]|jgi:HD-GYP domain-containing protein (c-di-GMP phosphodiesterase class II)
MPQIRVKTGKQKGKIVSLQNLPRLVIGRDATCGLQIGDQGVSREHAEIFRVGEMVFIRDLGSRNGSFVNDEKISEELLREGDNLRVGNTQLSFESSKAAKEQDLQFDDADEPFKTSLDLKLDDLYVSEYAGHESEMFKAMCEAARIFQGERDEKKLFERLLDLIQDEIPADYIYLFLREDASGAVTPRAMRQKAEKKNVPISRSILRRVITESRAILTADAMQDDRFKADDSIVMNQIRAVLCVPIQGRSKQAMGALYAVNSSLSETFEQSDLQLISAMCSQLAAALENLATIRTRRRMFLRTIGRMISLLEGAPEGQRGHSERVSFFASVIATEMALLDNEILSISMAGLLHDTGSIQTLAKLPEDVLSQNPNAPLLAACDLFKNIPGMPDVLPSVRTHKENFDGTGTPQGLKGESIPLGGRILAVANGFDVLMFPRGSAAALEEPDAASVKTAFTELDQQAGKLYDANVVRALFVSFRHGSLRSVISEEAEQAPPPAAASVGPFRRDSTRSTPPVEGDGTGDTIRTNKKD